MKRLIKKCIKTAYRILRAIIRLIPLPSSTKMRIKNMTARALDRLYVSLIPGITRGSGVYVASHADKNTLLDNYENRLISSDEHINNLIAHNDNLNAHINNQNAHIDDFKQYTNDIFRVGKKCEDFVDYKKHNISFSDEDVKPIAFYLPQFYTFPENDTWWGRGFTEWTNVTKAMPQFIGHYQPHLPYDSTFYDQSNIDVIRHQTQLAKNYGIYGFCFHYYWFCGKRLLEKPLDLLLNSDIDFPFCINWANENWTRRWDGQDQDVLIAQHHSSDDDLACIKEICKYIKDERYIRIDGKPLIIIYYPGILPDANKTIAIWRKHCKEIGIGEICLAATNVFGNNPLTFDFDKAIAFPPNDIRAHPMNNITPMNPEFAGTVYDMDEYISSKRYLHDYNPYYCAIPGWDNTARRGPNFSAFQMNPSLYKKWLLDMMCHTKETRKPEDRFVFINAWNEWAEGAHLEPDRKYGYASLQSTAEAVLESQRNTNRKIIYVSHDAAANGAQICSLNIIRQLRDTFKYNVYVIIKSGGKLLEQFKDVAKELICIDTDTHDLSDLTQWIKSTGAKKAICNTVVTGDVLKVLHKCDVECISAIHEMENVIRDYSCENNLKDIVEFAKSIVFASTYVKQSANKVIPIPDSKSIILPQGIYTYNPYLKDREQVRTEIRHQYQIPLDSKIVLGVGYGDYRKGVDIFAKCANLTPAEIGNIVYMWVGDIEPSMLSGFKESLIHSPPNVTIINVPFQKDVMRYYAAADLYLLTSREDPFPTVVMEAMNASLPVVAFEDGGGYVEIVTEQTGGLVPMENVNAMAEFVNELFLNDSKRKALGDYAFNLVSIRFNFISYIYSLLSLLGEDFKKISVVVPNYNYSQYLHERIDSVLAQNYPVFEIFLLDDCSSDNSVEIFKEYQQKHPLRIHLITNEKNSGNVFKQWELGISMSKGDYIWIAEADDLCESAFLETLMEQMSNNEKIKIGYTQSKMIDENGFITNDNYFEYTNDVDSEIWRNDYLADSKDEIEKRLSIKCTIPNVSAVVFKNENLTSSLQNVKKYKVAGDWRFYIDILKKDGTLFYSFKNLNHHRRHTASVTGALNAQRHYDEICEVQDYVYKLTKNEDYYKRAKVYRKQVKEYLGV